MERRTWSHVLLHPLFLILYLDIIFFLNMAMAQTTPTRIRVGVVLDMENDEIGQMGLNSISMAVSDFYATNGSNYKTRMALSIRDSKGTAVGAAAATLDLLKNVEVQAIIGPLLSSQASFMIDLGDQAHVPIITFSAKSPSLSSLRSPYFIRATLDDSLQVPAITAIIQAFGWRQVVPIFVDNEFGEGIIPYLIDALEQVNTRVPYRSIISSLATDDQIVVELYKLMRMQTRVFIVHMVPPLGTRLFTKAKQLGMMSEEYAWILTNGMTNVLNLVDPSVLESMLGVIGVKPYIPETNELDQFKSQYKRRLQKTNSTALSPDINIFGLWAYDSATALAMAVEKASLTNASFQKSNISTNATDLEAIGVSVEGPNLVQALSSTTFKGLAGEFRLVVGQLQSPPYEIVNVVGPSARGIGYWTKENGIIKELNFTNTNSYSTSKSNFRTIVWPGDTTSPPKGWVVPTNEKKLRIGVPIKSGFTEFVRVTWKNSVNSTKADGYCINVFNDVMEAMPYGVPYEYVPFSDSQHKAAGSYNELTDQVYFGNYDAIVGDVTIVANRSNYVDFTLPYTESSISMVSPITEDTMRKDAFVFFKPLTVELWLTSGASFLIIGILIWIFEHRVNEDFSGATVDQVGMIFWFAFSTMVFNQKEKVVSNLSKLLLIVWFFVVFILTSSYTASLTSMLTVPQLHPTVTDINTLIKSKQNVGYQVGSFVFDMLKDLGFEESRLLAYNSKDEMHEFFSKGSGNESIAAAFDETPYIKLFLGKYCSKYTMVDLTDKVDPEYKVDGLGFVFPRGSPLVADVSRAILNVTHSEKILDIERRWFGDKTRCQHEDPSPLSSSLRLESFCVLFVFGTAIPALLAFIIFFGMFMYENWDVVEPDATVAVNIGALYKRFLAKDPNAKDFRLVDGRERAAEARREDDQHREPENPPNIRLVDSRERVVEARREDEQHREPENPPEEVHDPVRDAHEIELADVHNENKLADGHNENH